MILIFGGTTEGRIAAKVCDHAAKSYLYATKGEDQRLLASYAEQIYGAMSEADIEGVITSRGVDLIIDAAHPYAEALHTNIAQAAEMRSITTVRFERLGSRSNYHKLHYFDSLADVITHIKSEGIYDVLALTGVKSAALFAPIAKSHRLTLRVMDREESMQLIEKSRFPIENIIYYDLGGAENYSIDQKIGAIVTKESGESGGFSKKIELAESHDIPIFVVKRPQLPNYTSTIYGEFGLRREIETLLPRYYELRTGFTTGSAATAATVAALKAAIFGEQGSHIVITLPNNEPYTIPIEEIRRDGDSIYASVVKDGGDDPDATHNIVIAAKVSCCESTESRVTIKGGEGVGRVTLPGIGIDIGEAAINPIPQEMIRNNVMALLSDDNRCYDVEVEISVPEGEMIAKKTFNPRLGIINGISILGTSGIVQPFSSEAFIDSIARQIDIVKALGEQMIVINSGAMSERYIKSRYPDLPPQCYIHYGNLIGETLRVAAAHDIKRVVLGVMVGKAVKLASGALDTHSKRTTLDRDFLISIARRAECTDGVISQIERLTTARQLWEIIPSVDHQFFHLIKECCYTHSRPLLPKGELTITLISERGVLI
ncbi:MAG: cobalt-precorrin-5B (C(1))-methyltransferase CbiD [Rikenellaceae bacterium]